MGVYPEMSHILWHIYNGGRNCAIIALRDHLMLSSWWVCHIAKECCAIFSCWWRQGLLCKNEEATMAPTLFEPRWKPMSKWRRATSWFDRFYNFSFMSVARVAHIGQNDLWGVISGLNFMSPQSVNGNSITVTERNSLHWEWIVSITH